MTIVIIAIPVAFVLGFALAVLLTHRNMKRARATRDLVVEELERTAWSLGGRLRGQDQPPLYLMPPGTEKEASCDVARLAWMDATHDAAEALRAAGMNATADKFYPASVQAKQFSAQTAKPPSTADGRKLFT